MMNRYHARYVRICYNLYDRSTYIFSPRRRRGFGRAMPGACVVVFVRACVHGLMHRSMPSRGGN